MKQAASGQAFGSVSAQDIVHELARQGIAVEKSWLKMDHAIKATGPHTIEIIFPHHITGRIHIIIN
jgi:ribosomal protein L9